MMRFEENKNESIYDMRNMIMHFEEKLFELFLTSCVI